MDRTAKLYLPRWAIILYGLLAIGLIPWIFNLAQNLPQRHLVHHWDAMWVGFDAIMFLALLLTIYFMLKRHFWVVLSATALATLFIVDAWFDILTARPGYDQKVSILFGGLETVLALLTYRLVFHVMRGSVAKKRVKIVPTDNLKL